MRKIVGCALALALGCVAGLAGPAAAAEPCGADDAAIKLRLVPAYANAGAPIDMVLSGYAPAGVVTGLTVAIGGVATPLTAPAGDARTLTVTAPTTLGATQLTLTWEQTEGYGWPTCSGRLVFDVMVLDASAVIGDTESPRVDGRWRAYYTPLDYANPAFSFRWPIKSACFVGACDFITLGLRYETDDGTVYRALNSPLRPTSTCTLKRVVDGRVLSRRVIRRAYLLRSTLTLRVTRYRPLSSGLLQATHLEGLIRSTFTPTGEARAKGCHGVQHKRTRLVAVRR